MAEVKELDPKVSERLDKIDWKQVNEHFGLTRKDIEAKPAIASQLAYQQFTDLIYCKGPYVLGQFSLRAQPGKDDKSPWKVLGYPMEKALKETDRMFLYGCEITSEPIKKALVEKAKWENVDGKTVVGYANANAGRPVAIMQDGEGGEKKKEYYLVSIHQPTNRIVGLPVNVVKSMLQNPDGTSRGTQVYGVTLDNKQVESLCKGEAVMVYGCKNKEGQEFNTAVQFDVARRQIVPCHPAWLKEAERAGIDVKGTAKAQSQEAKTKEARGKTKTVKPAVKTDAGQKLKI